MTRLRANQLDRQYLAEFLDSPELQSILENPLPTMLWTPDTHHDVAAWVRDSGRSHRRTAESNSRAASRRRGAQSTQKRGVSSTGFRLRQTLEHPAELADISREIWSQALVKKDGLAPVSLSSAREEQVISKTNCRSLINLEPVGTDSRGLLQSALDSLFFASQQLLNSLTRTPRSQRQE